jgi:predicted transcriptional regulator
MGEYTTAENVMLTIIKYIGVNKKNIVEKDKIILNPNKFVTITPNKITASGIDITKKMNSKKIKVSKKIKKDFKNFCNFLDDIKNKNINHIGASYSVANMEKEKKSIIKKIKKNKNYLYNDIDSNENSLMLYLTGAKMNTYDILFEFVYHSAHRPRHYQIDIDSKLTEKQINMLSKKHFGKVFYANGLIFKNKQGQIDLVMGDVMEINGIRIRLGVGTTYRNISYDRNTDILLF